MRRRRYKNTTKTNILALLDYYKSNPDYDSKELLPTIRNLAKLMVFNCATLDVTNKNTIALASASKDYLKVIEAIRESIELDGTINTYITDYNNHELLYDLNKISSLDAEWYQLCNVPYLAILSVLDLWDSGKDITTSVRYSQESFFLIKAAIVAYFDAVSKRRSCREKR